METEASVTENPAMTFDEVSMERSKSFVKALQELKNLRPQLYSAADYCEKSYLHSEQKQMVLDNLKDYTVKALVNAVDHLGTVASKLTDLFDQQSSDVSTMEMRASCVSQQLLTCRTYIDKEGLRQQQLLAVIPLHHKHYILPNSVNKRVHFSPLRRSESRQNHSQAISRLQPSDAPASKSLSWHLGSDTKSTLKGTTTVAPSSKDSKAFAKTSGVFHLLGDEENIKPLVGGSQVSGVPGTSSITRQTYGVAQKDMEAPKLMTGHKSLDNPRREIIQAPVRTKSVLSAFFVKQKTSKLKAGYV
ncbi:PREDICTED: protein ABIL1 [Brassica oleracea var. oleracea]|uniref:Protein ABIL1 n=1 Tax=Brassica oleracea var. oleracea TaxID=109376 RepID=A0A0D2ZTT9_BRAOL|nr:PREDICTED: protein ABIL1 [Brassica oleracea var. oleracea]